MNSSFLHHEPCPRCGSRDNLGVWDDGHKYCFGCRFYIPSPESIDILKKKTSFMEQRPNNAFNLDTSGFTFRIPDRPLRWLKKYGLSEFEIEHYKIQWNEHTQSLVFPITNDRGEMIYCQERYFGPPRINQSKYVTHGSKSQQLAYIRNDSFPKTVVLVEDYLSSIKVARVCSSSPLLGSSIDGNAIKWLYERFNRVRVWLDLDKAIQSLQEASKLSQVISDTRVILTTLDPKEYTTNEIITELKRVGIESKL